MNKKFVYIGLILFGMLASVLFLLKGGSNDEAPSAAKARGSSAVHREVNRSADDEKMKVSERDPDTLPFRQEEANLFNDPTNPEEYFEFAQRTEDGGYSEEDVIESLEMMLNTFRRRASGGYYETNVNSELTRGLLGDNKAKVGYLSAKSKRINDKGEIVDDFGTPYDFHFISGERLIIRSAGEDLELYTDDDVTSAREIEVINGVQTDRGNDLFRVAP